MSTERLELERPPMSRERLAAEQLFTVAPVQPTSESVPVVIVHRKRHAVPLDLAPHAATPDETTASECSHKGAPTPSRPPRVFLIGSSATYSAPNAEGTPASGAPASSATVSQSAVDAPPASHGDETPPVRRLRRRRDPTRDPKLIRHVVFDASQPAGPVIAAESSQTEDTVDFFLPLGKADRLAAYSEISDRLSKLHLVLAEIERMQSFDPFPTGRTIRRRKHGI